MKISLKSLVAVWVVMMSWNYHPLMASTVIGPDEGIVIVETVVDTIPLRDRYGDFVTEEYYNPFDITPSIVEQTVEYDIETGQYVVMEKIGDQFYRTPTYLSLEEYLDWQQEKQEKEHLRKLTGTKSLDFSRGLKIDPMSEIDISGQLADRLFGGTEVSVKPVGNVDVSLGYDFQILEGGPNLTDENRFTGGINFDQDINIGVDGSIGEKLNLGFSFNNQATFDFDNQLNLGYLADAFDEDGIIKNIEAGNVSFPLQSQLINGSQDLFGLKTELQFGKFRLTGVVSQSRSEAETISLENGNLIQEFELRPDDYDENRHYLISHYNREIFEDALSTIPQVRSLMRITNLEVWVTVQPNDDLQGTRPVAAISFLGESNTDNFSNPNTVWQPSNTGNPLFLDVDGNQLPDNDNSDLFRGLVNDDLTRQFDNTTTLLRTRYGLNQVEDFEVQTMRRLRPSEYTFNPELGFLSLNVRLQPTQVLGVSYEYTYTLNGNEVYKVGEISNESNTGGTDEENNPAPTDVIYVKMLKRSIRRVDLPAWDLMMKNIYSLNSASLSQDGFELDIFYEDNETSTIKRFIPAAGFDRIPLLNLFQLDRLNSRNDPQPDGVFDFIPGVTVNSRTGSIIFPVLEPFGNSLRELLNNDEELFERFGFPELYENTVTIARENLERNRFLIRGELKSNFSSEISLGSFNIPRGSVTVRAGSQELREGIDYEIDYGIGRLKILNDAFIQQGVPIRVSFEDQNLFGLQQKTLFALRGELEVNDNLRIGATYQRLFERPFTQKVNLGDDPINNRIFGLDVNYTSEAPFLTRLVDKLPFYSTNEASSLSLSAEVAAIKPGTSGAINDPTTDSPAVSIDDFEGATSSVPLGNSPTRWTLASTPLSFPESELTNDLAYGANRALVNWYVVNDFSIRTQQDNDDSYTRRVDQDELFERQLDVTQIPDLLTFDVSYYPSERGPYNYDLPQGTSVSAGIEINPENEEITLRDPASRWGGIMRFLDTNNDFQAANIEYIDFWMLNPFLQRRDGDHLPDESGTIVFDLGNISEDVLNDNIQSYENSLPLPDELVATRQTVWGEIPLTVPNVDAFDRNNFDAQDLGFDGLDDVRERDQFRDYIDAVSSLGLVNLGDPSNDNFVSFRDNDVFSDDATLLERYRRFNHPQGNAQNNTGAQVGLGNPEPDTEDLNGNRSLEKSESYWEYPIAIRNLNGELDLEGLDFVTDVRIIPNPQTQEEEKWYRFRIPLESGTPINGIEGFQSIQFMRMYMTGFDTPKTFRLADLELIRNQWRRLPIDETCLDEGDPTSVEWIIDEVGVQENSARLPFNYILPMGIVQERFVSTFTNVLQDENSMSASVCNLPDSCEVMAYRLTELDMRLYDSLQLFVHAEARDELMDNGALLEDGQLSAFIRVGKDFDENYYEYELPLTLSDPDNIAGNSRQSVAEQLAYTMEVWREENEFNFDLSLFTDAKIQRNLEGIPKTEVWELPTGDPNQPNARIRIKGTPTLGLVRGIVLGLRNNIGEEQDICAEVWFNELRLKGLNNRGGTAGVARVDLQLADLGNITMSGNFSTIGFGQIDQQIQERSLDLVTEYDIATNLELGKFTPESWGLSIPFYYQFARSIRQAEFDPYDTDLRVDTLRSIEGFPDIEDLPERSQERTTIQTFNFTNVRKQRTSDKAPKPWDISNISASYSHTKTTYSDAILLAETTTDQRGDLTYGYSTNADPIKPFDGIKSKALKLIKEFNFNPVPNTLSFSTQLRRLDNQRIFRLPDPDPIDQGGEGVTFAFDDQRFNWTRNYGVAWDLSKSLKLNYSSTASAVVDELRQVGVADDVEGRDWVNQFGENVTEDVLANENLPAEFRRENLRNFGRLQNFNQDLSINYTVPFKYIPGLDWITARANYNANYTWNAGSLSLLSLIEPDLEGAVPWHTIQNDQTRSINATLDFEKLYNKIPYLKKLQGGRPTSRSRSRNARGSAAEDASEGPSKKDRELTTIEKIVLRPLLSIREARLTYRESLGTVIPGFTITPNLFGLNSGAPGVGFVFGQQPNINVNDSDNFLRNAVDQGWITPTRFQNQQVQQNNVQNYEARITVEPWKDFDIDLRFNKRFTRNHREDFVNRAIPGSGEVDLQQVALRDFGSYEVSFFAVNTLFNSDIDELFERFRSFLPIISNRLPTTDNGQFNNILQTGFAEGLGSEHVDVQIAAFIAAYTGRNPRTIDLDLTESVSSRGFIPRPNWQLRYNGLSKLEWFKNIFSNISIAHGYTSTLGVNSFQTDLQFDAANPFTVDPDIQNRNFFARFEIPQVVIEERFQPVIGIDFRTRGNVTANYEFARSRALELATGLGQITERNSTEHTAGFGWIKDDVNIGFLTGQKKTRRSRSRDNSESDNPESARPTDPRNPVADFQRRLQVNMDLSIRDDVTLIHNIGQFSPAEPIRGTFTVQLSPSVEYDINKFFALRLFMDYNQTKPKISGGFDVTSVNTGLTARFNLQ